MRSRALEQGQCSWTCDATMSARSTAASLAPCTYLVCWCWCCTPPTHHDATPAVEQFASALELSPEVFAARYGFSKPAADAVVVLHGRTSHRSSWAAVLGADAGLRRCYVYAQGTYGWRASPDVAVYEAFDVTQPPPEPEQVASEALDTAAGRVEVARL